MTSADAPRSRSRSHDPTRISRLWARALLCAEGLSISVRFGALAFDAVPQALGGARTRLRSAWSLGAAQGFSRGAQAPVPGNERTSRRSSLTQMDNPLTR